MLGHHCHYPLYMLTNILERSGAVAIPSLSLRHANAVHLFI
jgi:hypothetical protein